MSKAEQIRDEIESITNEEIVVSNEEMALSKMLKSALTSGYRMPLDLKIDDRDLEEFPNFYQFCFNKKGSKQIPYARQMAIATRLLAEWCPLCSGEGFEDIENIPIDYPSIDFPEKVTFLEYGVCPDCGTRKHELYKQGHLKVYRELAGCAGQRSGKSALLSMISPYLLHKWLKMQRPAETLGLMSNSLLVATFVALTFKNAVNLLWIPMREIVMESVWFKEYFDLLDFYEEKYGKTLYKLGDEFMHFRQKNIMFLPSGPNKRTLRGPTRILTCIDELGWFPHGESSERMEKLSANEVYTALDRSLLTVRQASFDLLKRGYDNIPMAFACNISSPSSHVDKIMTLVKKNKESKSILTYHLPTWGMNPKLPKSAFRTSYQQDPIKTERDYGANPPMANNPWIHDISRIESAINKDSKTEIQYIYKHISSKSDQQYRYAELTSVATPDVTHPSVMALDAGLNRNSFAIVILTPIKDDITEVTAMVEIAPYRGKNMLNYTRIVDRVLFPLIEEFNVQLLVVDRWQSVKILSDVFERYRIFAESASLDKDDFGLIYDYLMDDRSKIYFPKPEVPFREIQDINLDGYPHCFKYMPIAHLYFQFMITNINIKGVLEKGEGYTDDLLRATCLGLTFCLSEEWRSMVQRSGDIRDNNASSRFLGTKTGSKSNPNSRYGIKVTQANIVSSRGGSFLGARG